MAYIPDWVKAAADDIYNGEDTSVETIAAVIERHCPFKRDTAYVEVDLSQVKVKDQNEEI